MNNPKKDKRILFDLNHPADFHFFRNLLVRLSKQGYQVFVIARDKDCLQDLLRNEGISFTNRGKGSHSKTGKYIFGVYVVLLLFLNIMKRRPSVTISLSSPYLALTSRILGIPCITYDDTDDNPRLIPMIRKSRYVLSPLKYPHKFHRNHFHLQAFKELAYLHPVHFQKEPTGNGVFFRLTRTDSIHHSSDSKIDLQLVLNRITRISRENPTFLSSEVSLPWNIPDEIMFPDALRIHEALNKCRAFWGNSATMAAEAAVLGIPAVFISSEKFAYIHELEAYGLLFCYRPNQLEESFRKLEDLLAVNEGGIFEAARRKLLEEKIDITEFLYWFIINLPDSAAILRSDPGYHLRFIS